MCTAISFKTNAHYFGRNLDFEHGFGEKIIITPRNFPFEFRNGHIKNNHYAIIGMAVEAEGYPLYFDATNEVGLSMAGLNFPGNAHYFPPDENYDCVSPFELIPWFLCQCKAIVECRILCKNLRITNIPFNDQYTLTPLHWIIADRNECIVIESTRDGLNVYDDAYGVLTNNPPFPYHLYNISNYINVTAQEAVSRFAPDREIDIYSRGMGGIGLPGDLSSSSRFVRAAFTKLNSKCTFSEEASVVQFFHILNSVYQVNGCVEVGGQLEKTIYTSCCNTDRGIYYYTTYENPQINAVHLHRADLSGNRLQSVELSRTPEIISSL